MIQIVPVKQQNQLREFQTNPSAQTQRERRVIYRGDVMNWICNHVSAELSDAPVCRTVCDPLSNNIQNKLVSDPLWFFYTTGKVFPSSVANPKATQKVNPTLCLFSCLRYHNMTFTLSLFLPTHLSRLTALQFS